MIIGIKFRTYALLAVALLASILILPGIALATDSSSDILEKVNYDKTSLRFAEVLDNFETVTANPDIFLEDVTDGRVKMKLLGKEFDLELENTHILNDDAKVLIDNETGSYAIPAAKINTYRGKVVGEENSDVGFAVSDEALIGHIEVGSTYSYTILSTTYIDILPAYDQDFKNIYGSDSTAQAEILSRINDAGNAYSPASVVFRITNYKKYGYLSSGTG